MVVHSVFRSESTGGRRGSTRLGSNRCKSLILTQNNLCIFASSTSVSVVNHGSCHLVFT